MSKRFGYIVGLTVYICVCVCVCVCVRITVCPLWQTQYLETVSLAQAAIFSSHNIYNTSSASCCSAVVTGDGVVLCFLWQQVQKKMTKRKTNTQKKRDKNQSDSKLKGSFDCHVLNLRKYPPDIQSINPVWSHTEEIQSGRVMFFQNYSVERLRGNVKKKIEIKVRIAPTNWSRYPWKRILHISGSTARNTRGTTRTTTSKDTEVEIQKKRASKMKNSKRYQQTNKTVSRKTSKCCISCMKQRHIDNEKERK